MNIRNEKVKALRKQAMPEVKRLVSKFGRSIVSGCLTKLSDYDKKMKNLKKAKEEVSKLEKELNKK